MGTPSMGQDNDGNVILVGAALLRSALDASHREAATAEVVRDFPLSSKGSAAEAKIVLARGNKHARRPHTGGQATCYPTVSVVRRVLRLRRVSAVRRLRLLDHREDLHPGLRGYRARQMILGDWRVLCEAR